MFLEADHLLYWIHVKDNLEKKLNKLGIINSKTYLDDILE